MFYIEGLYKPLPHQVESARFKMLNRRAFDLSTMRTGKTGSSLLALEALIRMGAVTHCLIIAPLSCVRPVWLDALQTSMPQRISTAAIGLKSKRADAFQSADIVVTNYETVKLNFKQCCDFHPQLIIIDELTAYANLTTQRTKAVIKLIKFCGDNVRVWGLTGTPGHDPLKAFAMSKVVNPEAVKCNSIYAWRDLTQYKYGQQAWMWKNRDECPQLIKSALSPAILYRKEDLFDLPPVAWIAREAEFSTEQETLYKQLKDDMIAFAREGTVQITAVQKSALVSKLLQAALGSVLDDHGTAVQLECNPRLEQIRDLIEEAEYKTVIFVPFTAPLHRLYDQLQTLGYKCGLVDGSTPEAERSRIFADFKNTHKNLGGIDVLLAHPRTTAFGVELASADMMIFNGPPLSGDFVFGQAVERLSSLKQKAEQITIAQVYTSLEERNIFQELRQGRDMSAAVADLFTEIVR